MFSRRFKEVKKRRGEGINPASQILKINQDNIESVHHPACRTTDIPIQAEYLDAVDRIGKVRRLDHVVLLVAPQSVLRSERGRDLNVAAFRQRVQRVREIAGNRSRMRQ